MENILAGYVSDYGKLLAAKYRAGDCKTNKPVLTPVKWVFTVITLESLQSNMGTEKDAKKGSIESMEHKFNQPCNHDGRE